MSEYKATLTFAGTLVDLNSSVRVFVQRLVASGEIVGWEISGPRELKGSSNILPWVQLVQFRFWVSKKGVFDVEAIRQGETQSEMAIYGDNDWYRMEPYWKRLEAFLTDPIETPTQSGKEAMLLVAPAPIELPDPAPTDPPSVAKDKADKKYPKTGKHIHPGWWQVMCLWFDSYSKQEGVHYTNEYFAALANVDVRQVYRAKKQYRRRGDL